MIHTLPDDILYSISKSLTKTDFIALSQTCKKFKNLYYTKSKKIKTDFINIIKILKYPPIARTVLLHKLKLLVQYKYYGNDDLNINYYEISDLLIYVINNDFRILHKFPPSVIRDVYCMYPIPEIKNIIITQGNIILTNNYIFLVCLDRSEILNIVSNRFRTTTLINIILLCELEHLYDDFIYNDKYYSISCIDEYTVKYLIVNSKIEILESILKKYKVVTKTILIAIIELDALNLLIYVLNVCINIYNYLDVLSRLSIEIGYNDCIDLMKSLNVLPVSYGALLYVSNYGYDLKSTWKI